MRLNENELLWGFCYACAFVVKIGWIALFLAPLSAYLWALTGWGASKLWRRLCIPAMTSLMCAIALRSWYPILSIPMAYGVLCIGYGIPYSTDSGSWLGRMAYNLSPYYAEIITRSIIISLLLIANIPTILS